MNELAGLRYLSKTPGIGGAIKEQVDDFIVREEMEIYPSKGDHLIVRMKKFNMTTLDAVRDLSNILHISQKRIGYAGNKDRRGITTQFISLHKVVDRDIHNVYFPQMELEVLGMNGHIALGQHWGNAFNLAIRNLSFTKEDIFNRISRIWTELDGIMPNYFGEQRFGSLRSITHLVGREILRENFGKAVWLYIGKAGDNEPMKIRKVRKELWETRDPIRAAERFPETYRFEKILLYQLAKNPKNYLGAIKALPGSLQRLFIHAYQSYLFNNALSELIKEKDTNKEAEIPLVGFRTQLGKKRSDGVIKELLEKERVTTEMFKLRSLPNLRSEGEYRKAFVPIHDFRIDAVKEDDLNIEKNIAEISFRLEKGAYATAFVRELMKR